MKISMKISYIIMFTLILAGIFIAWYNFTPIIIETPEPNLTVDISPFIEAGCVKKKNYLDCSKINLEKKFNCKTITIPSKYLGGLSPKLPMVECNFFGISYSISGNGEYFPITSEKCKSSPYFYSSPSYVIIGEIKNIKQEKVNKSRCSATKIEIEIEPKRVFKGNIPSHQTIFAYFYKNVTGKCFSESPFDVKINDKILVLLSQRYFSQCIINLDENEFNRLITIPNLTFSEEGIIGKGCLRPVFNKYIIWNNGTFAVIRNKEEFKKFFAPIETPEEALSFAIAITGSYPKYDINISKNDFVILAPVIKGTYVKEVSNGFKVHLFDYQLCGCGYHPHYTVDYLVTKTGDIKEISRQVIYKLRYLMCVD